MRITPSFLAITLSILLILSCKKTADSPNGVASETATKQNSNSVALKPEIATFTIDGMTCAIGCAKTLQEKLTAMEGVQKATVDFDKKLATIAFDASILTPELLLKAVEETGDGKTYTVSNMKSEAVKK